MISTPASVKTSRDRVRRVRLLVLLAGIVPPRPSPSPNAADSGNGDHTGLLIVLVFGFGIPMFGLLCMGFGSLYDYFQTRGWRHPSQRRPLK